MTSTQVRETKKCVTNSKRGFVTRKLTWSFITLDFRLIVFWDLSVVSHVLYCLRLKVRKKVPHELAGGSLTTWNIWCSPCVSSALEMVWDYCWVLVVDYIRTYCPNLKHVCMLWSLFLIQLLHLIGTTHNDVWHNENGLRASNVDTSLRWVANSYEGLYNHLQIIKKRRISTVFSSDTQLVSFLGGWGPQSIIPHV